MPDQFTEVTSQSWFSRLGGAIKGVLTGLLLLVIACPLLFWNEGRTVKEQKSLAEGGKNLVTIAADAVDAANDGKLVHVTGKALTDATLSDPDFGVSVSALKLNRESQMYQWQEDSEKKTETKLGGGTETVTKYTYAKNWSGSVINSSKFKQPEEHRNPEAMAYPPAGWVAENVKLGAFQLPRDLVERISGATPVAVDTVPAALQGRARPHGGGIYFGSDPAAPAVGDLRVSFTAVKNTDISVIARQAGGSFAPYTTSAGGTIELLSEGIRPAAEMIQSAQASNAMLAWVLRGAGFLLLLTGFNLLLRPLGVLADVLPFLGSITRAGTGLISLLLAAALSLISIGAGWIFYRPLLGAGLLAAAAALFVVIGGKLRKEPAAEPVPGQREGV